MNAFAVAVRAVAVAGEEAVANVHAATVCANPVSAIVVDVAALDGDRRTRAAVGVKTVVGGRVDLRILDKNCRPTADFKRVITRIVHLAADHGETAVLGVEEIDRVGNIAIRKDDSHSAANVCRDARSPVNREAVKVDVVGIIKIKSAGGGRLHDDVAR